MFNHHDITRNACMLHGALARHGYDWWWHSFTAQDAETGEDKPFFIEFYVCNPALAEDEPVLGQLPANQKSGKKPSYLMVKAGTWGEDACQLHRFFAWKDVNMHGNAPYQIEAADCLACETVLKGKISVTPEEAAAHPEWMCDAGEMSWDISVDKQIAFNVGYGASKPLRDAEAFAMYWHAEGMKTAYSGNVTFNGRKYTVTPECSYGYADKNWGRDFTTPWVWLSSNCLTSKKTGQRLQNSVFDIGGGRPKIYFVPLDRRLLGVFYYEGREYDFNFSKLHLRVKTDFSFEEHDEEVIWHVRQENIHAAMETEVHCLKKDMLLINYEAPDGSRHHNRLWNGGNGWGTVKLYDRQDGRLILTDEIEATHIGCEYGEYDHEKPYSGEGGSDYRPTDKILVAYFSASGVTAKVAERMAKAARANLFEIKPKRTYTKADLNWMDQQSRSTLEMKDRNCRPDMAEKPDISGYDVILVGFPIWWYREPSIIDTFMESADFSGKTIVPFCTSGGSGLGDSAKNMQALAPGAKVLDGKRFSASASPDELKKWAEQF